MGLFRTALQESRLEMPPALCVIVSFSHFQRHFSTHVLLTGDDGHRTSNIRHDGEVHLPRPEDRRTQTTRGCLLSGDAPQPCIVLVVHTRKAGKTYSTAITLEHKHAD